MIENNKPIINGCINFLDEVRNDTKVIIRDGYGRTTQWGATIRVYATLKYIERIYFDFLKYEIKITNINIGDVLNIRDEKKICDSFSYVCDEYFLITSINNNEVKMEKYETIAKAVGAQRKKALNGGFLLISKKSIWKKYEKHTKV